MTEIGNENDIYNVGSLSACKAIHDKNHPLSPYMLSVIHQQKAQILEFIQPAKAMARVNLVIRDYGRMSGPAIRAPDLLHQELVLYKFLQEEYTKLKRMHNNENGTFFKSLEMLERNYDQTNVRDFINLLLTVIALPSYINDKKFLLDVSKHQLQTIYETDEIEHALKATNDLFSDFVNKYQIWNSLEQQHDIRQDQAAA